MKNARLLDVISYMQPLGTFKQWYESFTVFQDCFLNLSVKQQPFEQLVLSHTPFVCIQHVDLESELFTGVFNAPCVFKITTGTVDWYIEYDPSSILKNQSFTRDFLCYHMEKDPEANIAKALPPAVTDGILLPPEFIYDIHVAMMEVDATDTQRQIALSTPVEQGYFDGAITNIRHHTDRVSFNYEGDFVIGGSEKLSFSFKYEGQGICTRGILKWKENLVIPPAQLGVKSL